MSAREGSGVRVIRHKLSNDEAPKVFTLEEGRCYTTPAGRLVMITSVSPDEVLCRFLDVIEKEYVSFRWEVARRLLMRT